jgi:catechol 2,3-dioxygenase-like lactoylglutathione lyase family enzyme
MAARFHGIGGRGAKSNFRLERTGFAGRSPGALDAKRDIMTVKRMDNVGIVVENIDAAIEFFTELGLELEGRAPIAGDWADGVTGLRDMRVEIAMMRTPDGHSRLEMSRFLAPPVVADHRKAPVNALGYLRVMFTVEDIDDTLARLGKRGAELVGRVTQYEDTYRLCYIRGPEGILIGLAQELGRPSDRRDR